MRVGGFWLIILRAFSISTTPRSASVASTGKFLLILHFEVDLFAFVTNTFKSALIEFESFLSRLFETRQRKIH